MYFVGAVGCKLQVKHVRGGVVPPTRFFARARRGSNSDERPVFCDERQKNSAKMTPPAMSPLPPPPVCLPMGARTEYRCQMARDRELNWIRVLGIWTLVGIGLVVMLYVNLIHDVEHYDLKGHFYTFLAQMYRAWIWALLTPVIFQFRREVRRRHSSWLAVGGLHLLAAVTLLAWCNIMRIWAMNITFRSWDLDMYSFDYVLSLLSAYTLVDFYLYWLIVGAGALYDLDREKRLVEQHEEQLRTQLAQAELAALRQQLHPHFLFNSLNAVSSLMREGATERAVEAIALLSQLLRDLLSHTGQQEIELRRELAYVECYLSVEKVRFEDRLIIHFDADEECLDALVPTLILQPLVENAVKHGIARRVNPGRVSVYGFLRGDKLQLKVCNDSAEGAQSGVDSVDHGIGLRATRLRLERIFGSDYRLDCAFGGPQGAVVIIEIPLRMADISKSQPVLCKV
jgi:two-component system, LytTR family, sensor kinase